MAGLDVLTPTAPVPDARLYERLASLEARLAAVERQRDVWITRVALSEFPGLSASLGSHGGPMWVVMGGTATLSVAPPNTCGYKVFIDGVQFTDHTINVFHPFAVPLGMRTAFIGTGLSLPAGSHTVTIAPWDAATTQALAADLVFIELPA